MFYEHFEALWEIYTQNMYVHSMTSLVLEGDLFILKKIFIIYYPYSVIYAKKEVMFE